MYLPWGEVSILERMHRSLAIGDFSRATHLSIKTLRHYHRIGLLEPAEVDPGTGHRRYATDQIPTAQVIRRFRSLDMPLEEIQAVIAAPDLAHPQRADRRPPPPAGGDPRRERRRPPLPCATCCNRRPTAARSRSSAARCAATPAAAVRDIVDLEDACLVVPGRAGRAVRRRSQPRSSRRRATRAASSRATCSRTSAGEATVYVPCADPVRPTGRVTPLTVPAVELAVITHTGPTTMSTAPTGRWGPMWPSTPSASTARCASSTSSAPTTPPTRRCGGPRSAGRSLAPDRVPEQASSAVTGGGHLSELHPSCYATTQDEER